MRTGLLLLLGALVGGCEGFVDGENGPVTPETTIAELHLQADNLGALLARECTARADRGEGKCARYPNEAGFQQLTIKVRADGKTCAEGVDESGVSQRFCGSVAEGIPLICHARPDLSCQQCTDIYGNAVLDTCTAGTGGRATEFYSPQFGNGWQLSQDAAWIGDGTPTTPGENPPENPTVPGTGTDQCDQSKARLAYATELNKIMASEGLKLMYSPDLTKAYNNVDYWKYDPHKNKDACQYWLTTNNTYTQCWSKEGGKCHCAQVLGKPCCKCGRINVFALRAACKSIPKTCDYTKWVGGLVMEYGVATQWLFSGTYNNGSGGYSGLPSNPGTLGGSPGGNTQPPGAIVPPTCLGSPLVLDLGNDGVKPTSLEEGVTFDLLGHGVQRTAWIRGNDALLVLDRNGNGVIDDGSELFGEGATALDGFAALAKLDDPAQGGNGNGLLEAGDLLYGELRVWSDANGDGASQTTELRALAQAGVQSIGVQGTSCGRMLDAHGNDLGLRGSFTRTDGRPGLVVDVYFKAR
jgi:hypothetical protein